jgi:hypothetical protein
MDKKPKDRTLKFDERELLIEGVLLKVLHELEAINEYLEIAIRILSMRRATDGKDD